MKSCKWLSILYLVFFLTSFHITFSVISVEARKSSVGRNDSKHHKHKHHGNKGKGKSSHSCLPTPASPSSPLPGTQIVSNTSFNVLSFGAKGDGATDDSQALLQAWEGACKVANGVVEIPTGFKFFIKPITLKGPCLPQLHLQIDGTILAPPEIRSWPKAGLFQWINIKWVENFTIQGNGILDGQGYEWWSASQYSKNQKKSHFSHVPNMKPTALRFYGSNNVIVRDITIVNSPLCHLKFDNSNGIEVVNITISSPEDSPNTDGIHLQNTKDVAIHHSHIGCGDDCVSIQTGCSNVHVHHCNCGPGHGISLGGLGKDRSIACVSDIVVENIVMQNTLYGARIKTWPGGIGSAKNISFSSIQVSNVKVPLMIDQYYCENKLNCKNLTGAVAISEVEFSRIEGTYLYQPLHLACSNNIPCTDVNLVDIQLKPSPIINSKGLKQILCWNTYGRSEAPLMPSSIEDYCLRENPTSHGMVQRVHGSHEMCHATQ